MTTAVAAQPQQSQPATEAPQALELVPDPQLPAQFSAFGSAADFTSAQRMAKALYTSSIVPESYRGSDHLGDCVIALEIANRIGASVLAVMQNLYIVYGKPAWSSQFLISCVNASRKFSPLRYKMTGTKGQDSWGCIAWALDKTGERLESPEVTVGMAKSEGWFTKNGSKWKTMPELMLRYRAATLFARLYAPELTMGIQTADEIVDVAPVVTEQNPRRPIFDTPTRPQFSAESSDDGLGPVTTQQTQTQQPQTEPTTTQTESQPKPDPEDEKIKRILKALRNLMRMSGVSEVDLVAQIHAAGCDDSLGTLADIAKVAPSRIVHCHDNWQAYLDKVKGAAK